MSPTRRSQHGKICHAVKSTAQEVFNWISQQDKVGEESITDWSLYNTKKLNGNINYRLFDRITEARTTGADFEFWVKTKSTHFKARIQAKRLRIGKDHYSGIAYSNKHGLQIEKLMKDAKAKGFRPMYALYSNEGLDHRCSCKTKDEGMYLAEAQELYDDIINQPRTRIDTSFLIERSYPFSCWICLPSIWMKGNNAPKGTSPHGPQSGGKGSSLTGLTSSLPDYINSFVEMSQSKDITNLEYSSWEERFSKDINTIQGLFVVDMSNIDQEAVEWSAM